MSDSSDKKDNQIVFMFDMPQSGEKMDCKTKDSLEKGRILTDKLTQALNTLPPEYKQALAGGDFNSEAGIAALRALRNVNYKKDLKSLN